MRTLLGRTVRDNLDLIDAHLLRLKVASWWDHGRDLMFLINQYQDDIPHPIMGIGHSVGAAHL